MQIWYTKERAFALFALTAVGILYSPVHPTVGHLTPWENKVKNAQQKKCRSGGEREGMD